MPSIRYVNQSAPFWDFIASLETQGSTHPFFGGRSGEAHDSSDEEGPRGWGRRATWMGPWMGPGSPRGWHRGPPPPPGGPHGPHPFGHEGRPHPRHHGEHPPPPFHPEGGPHPPPPFPGDHPPPPPPTEGHPPPPPHMEGHPPPPPMEGHPPPPHSEGPPPPPPGPHDGPGPMDVDGEPKSPHHGGPPRPHHHRGGFGGRRGGFHGHRGRFGGRRGGSPPPFPRGGPFDFGVLGELFQLFGEQGREKDNADGEATQEDFQPEADVFDTENSYVIHVSLPGAKKEDVGISWDAEKSELSISGVIHRPGDEDFLKTLALDERKVGAFQRKIRLGSRANPAQVDDDAITAKLEDGVLRLEVPKLDKDYVEIKKVDIE